MLLRHYQHNQHSPLAPRRLVYKGEPTLVELTDFSDQAFEDKVKEHYDKKNADLAKEIEALEKTGKDTNEIRKELKSRQTKIAIEAFNEALKELKITYQDNGKEVQVNYFTLANHSDPAVVNRAAKIFEKFRDSYTGDVDKAVDQYDKEKTAATGKATVALTSIPKPTERVDLDSANPETARLQEVLDDRRNVLEQGRAERDALKGDKNISYRGRTNTVDALTNPEGGMIDDYDDGLFGKETDYTSYTRARLNGFLYANDIFAGGGDAGKKAVEDAIKKPYDLYHTPVVGDSRLTMANLSEGMQLQAYFEEAKKYTSFNEKGVRFDRALGTIAGLLKMTDDVIKETKLHDAYKTYLTREFDKIAKDPDLKTNEERQIQFLYSLQSFAEFINANAAWRTDFAKIERSTDPDREGDDVIKDYPDSGVFNVFGDDLNRERNAVREGLNGYLYSVHLFTDGNENSVKTEYQRAFTMYEDVWGDMFEQEHLDRESKGKDGDDDGFDLGRYLPEAEALSKHPAVKYAIAGLLKQTDKISNDTTRKNYRAYLDKKFKTLTPDDSEEAQMTMLSTIKSPEKADEEFKYTLHAQIMENVIEASRQHNQFKLDVQWEAELKKEPKTLTAEQFIELAAHIKASIDSFVTTRADADMKDIEKRFNVLLANNSKLKEPLITSTDLQELRQRIEDNSQEFNKAKAVVAEGELDKAVTGNYLKDLSSAEKVYFSLAEEVDAKLAAVHEQAKGTAPDQTPPVLPVTIGGGNDGGSEIPDEPKYDDSIHENWASAEREEAEMGDYVGPLIADSFSTKEKVEVRDAKGKLLDHLSNGEEVKRTAENAKELGRNVEGILFIEIRWHGKDVWAPEEQLFKKDDFDNPTTPETPTPKPPEAPPYSPPKTTPGESPRYAASYLDQLFDKISYDAERVPGGATFNLTYDGQVVACRAEKMYDGYHLKTAHVEAGNADVVFRNVAEIKNYVETGGLWRYLAMQTIMDQRNWDRFKHENWLDNVKEIKRTGPYSMYVEFDWKRNNAFEKGNGKVNINIAPDGRLNYHIEKDYAGANGENYREGFTGDFMQLVQTLNHTKNWSESYLGNKDSKEFPALQAHEKLLASLMDARTFEGLSPQIGEKYYFNHFDINGYAYMYLNWDNNAEMVSRNRSLNNPILEIKLTPQNTISWKLINRSGSNNAWMGISGSARDLNELARQVESVKQNPRNAMSTPAQNLPNLGYFGYSLY